MTMRALLVSVFLLLSPLLAHAEEVPLPVGGTTIEFPLPSGYVAVSKSEPRLFEYLEAATPPGNRLLEAFYTPDDLEIVLNGGTIKEIYYQAQVLRTLERKDVSIRDWQRFKPEVMATLQKLDANELFAKDKKRNERMSKAANKSVEVEFGKMGILRLYRETPTGVLFDMMIPGSISVDGDTQSLTLGMTGATLLLRNRVVYLYAYTPDISEAGIEKLHRHFDVTVDKMVALNASDSTKESSVGVNSRPLLGKVLLGGLALIAIIVLLVLFMRRRAG